MNEYFISISISELQQWLADDQFPITSERAIYIKKKIDAGSENVELEKLFKRLPAFALDDSAGVLIAKISSPRTWLSDNDPNVRYIKLSTVIEFIPLTEDAKAALNIRFSSVIKISSPFLESKFTRFRHQEKSEHSNRAGNLLVNIFINFGTKKFTVSHELVDTLPRALMAAEFKTKDEVSRIFNSVDKSKSENLMEMAFGYTRREPLIKIPDNIKSLTDVGVLLKEGQSSNNKLQGPVNELRDFCKKFTQSENKNNLPLATIYSDPELSRLCDDIAVKDIENVPVSIITLALFLRWKQAFHDQHSKVDPVAIAEDIKALAEQVDVKQVATALWMLGAYLGMGTISPLYRSLNQKEYPALQFGSTEPGLEPSPAWEHSAPTPQPIESEPGIGEKSLGQANNEKDEMSESQSDGSSITPDPGGKEDSTAKLVTVPENGPAAESAADSTDTTEIKRPEPSQTSTSVRPDSSAKDNMEDKTPMEGEKPKPEVDKAAEASNQSDKKKRKTSSSSVKKTKLKVSGGAEVPDQPAKGASKESLVEAKEAGDGQGFMDF